MISQALRNLRTHRHPRAVNGRVCAAPTWIKSLATLAPLTIGTAACTITPAPLDALEQELTKYQLIDDPADEDHWDSSWMFALNGGGDCEDWAAFSYQWLAERGLKPRLVIGTNAAQDLHAWVEVQVQGENWVVSNERVSWGLPGWRPLPQEKVDALVALKFGPGWPDSVGQRHPPHNS